jgi:hypothetical protein
MVIAKERSYPREGHGAERPPSPGGRLALARVGSEGTHDARSHGDVAPLLDCCRPEKAPSVPSIRLDADRPAQRSPRKELDGADDQVAPSPSSRQRGARRREEMERTLRRDQSAP